MTRGQMAHRVMKARGIPKTKRNRMVFMAWAQSEGGSAHNNMLNTTLPMPDSTLFNHLPGGGVRNYVSEAQGVEATARTFDTPGRGYDRFEKAMKDGADPAEICRMIGESSWGTGEDLIGEVLDDIHRKPDYLRTLERKQVAG